MYEVPGDETARELVLTADVIKNKTDPIIVHGEPEAKAAEKEKDKKKPLLKPAKEGKDKETA